MTTVHASPSYRIRPAGPPPPGYPTARDSQVPGYATQVPGTLEVPGTFRARRAAFLSHCLANPAPENTKAIYHELAGLAAASGGARHRRCRRRPSRTSYACTKA